MLDLAIKYQEQLSKLFLETRFDENYKYYNYGSYYNKTDIDDSTWNYMQYVSIDKKGNIVGYIDYSINRDANKAYSFSMIRFSKQTEMFFMKDVLQVVDDLFMKYNRHKLTFSVIIGNKAEKAYDKFVDKCNGRVVGVYKEEVKLFDGKLYDEKVYEIMKDDYLKRKEK